MISSRTRTLIAPFVLSIASAQAATIEYWDFNSSNKSPAIGAGTLDTGGMAFGFSSEGYTTGSTVNAVGATPAGNALTFFDPVAVLTNHTMLFQNLDFSGQTGVTFSFATFSDQIFQFGEEMTIEYDLGSGFTGSQNLVFPSSTFDTRNVDFGGALDGESDVTIRLSIDALFEVGSVLKIDNVRVDAIPEPSSAFLLVAALGVFGIRRRR